MTIADRARAHPAWEKYRSAIELADRCANGHTHESAMRAALAVASVLADDLGLTPRQRVNLLPMIARRRARPGRPPKPPRSKCCPHCGGVL